MDSHKDRPKVCLLSAYWTQRLTPLFWIGSDPLQLARQMAAQGIALVRHVRLLPIRQPS